MGSESQLAIYIIYADVSHAFPASGGQATCSNGVSGIYMDTVFKVVAQKEAEIYYIVYSRKAYYSSQVSS